MILTGRSCLSGERSFKGELVRWEETTGREIILVGCGQGGINSEMEGP